MSDKALISTLTWRTLESQRDSFPGMPVFQIPDDLSALLRPTMRKQKPTIHVVSLAVIADKEKDFKEFMQKAWKLGMTIQVKDGIEYYPRKPWPDVVEAWRNARREGAAKKGGEEMAERAQKKFWAGFAKIQDRWHLSSKPSNTSAMLLNEAGTTRNTVKEYLGYTRLEWRKLSDVQRIRILKRSKNNGSR